MEHVVPPSLLFDFRLQLLKCSGPATNRKGSLLNLPDAATVFMPSSLNEQTSFASIKLGWNTDGFGGCLTVNNKTSMPVGDLNKLDTSDSLSIWIDTRPSGTVHRATEYCHSFGFVAQDGENTNNAACCVLPIAQQRSSRVEPNPKKISLRTRIRKQEYDLEFWIPGTQLNGFREISDFGRLGFHFVVNDRELGEQTFGLGGDFPTAYDPSTWIQLELQS